MPIVGGLDIHRKQITFDYLDTATGEVRRGQIAPADRAHLSAWLARFAGRDDAAFALEGCTGWRYVAEELAAAGSNETRLICRPGFSLGAGALRRTPLLRAGVCLGSSSFTSGPSWPVPLASSPVARGVCPHRRWAKRLVSAFLIQLHGAGGELQGVVHAGGDVAEVDECAFVAGVACGERYVDGVIDRCAG
jgi:hypothetical protein